MVFGWIHIIDSEETYENLWELIIKVHQLYLGTYIVMKGLLKCKDGRTYGRKEEIIAGITTMTFEKEDMDILIRAGFIDPLKTILIKDLAPEELDKEAQNRSIIKKAFKYYANPSTFKNYLRKIQYKDFRFEE